MKTKTLSQFKKDVWKVFSLYIRTKYSVNGKVRCITCGAVKPIKEMQAGHGIGGRHNYLLFDEKIVFPQCPNCNIWRGGEYEKFAVILIKENGLDWYEDMTKYKPKQFTRKELEGLMDNYKNKLKQYGTT